MNFELFITKEKYIYKYLTVNINTLKLLINAELYFSIPENFNDPFDCKFNLNLDSITVEGIKSFYKDEEEIDSKIRQFQKDKDSILSEIEQDYNTGLSKALGITCFSENNKDILMWAHYANNFKGICLIFDWKIHKEFFNGYKVHYKESLPTVSYNGDGQFETSEILLTKLTNWKYEKEVRSIFKIDDSGNNPARFNPKALSGIIFGNKIDPKEKETIKNLINIHPKYLSVDFFNAVPNYKTQKVDIEKEQ
jgi:hypothetical protein